MRKFEPLTGKIGRVTIIACNTTKYQYKCLCECGRIFSTSHHLLKYKTRECFDCACGNDHLYINGKWFGTIKKGARQRNIDFLITKEDIWNLYNYQNKLCKLSGIELYLPSDRKQYLSNNFTVSIDRIDSKLPYTTNNIQIVHKDINLMKWNFSNSYFIELCKAVTKFKQFTPNKIIVDFPTRNIFLVLKHNAKRRNIEFDITESILIEVISNSGLYCSLSGLNLIRPIKKRFDIENTISIDRIDNQIGYKIDNIRVVHKHINTMKLDYDDNYYKSICKKVAEYNDN